MSSSAILRKGPDISFPLPRIEKGEERFMDKILWKKWESDEEKGHGAISQKRGRRALQ